MKKNLKLNIIIMLLLGFHGYVNVGHVSMTSSIHMPKMNLIHQTVFEILSRTKSDGKIGNGDSFQSISLKL